MRCLSRMVWCLGVLVLAPAALQGGESRSAERARMVEEHIRSRGVSDSAVLHAMNRVERHHFVPPSAQRSAYRDSPLPIGHGQTISQPYIVAFMTEIIAPHPAMRVLEIGAGSGYQAAVLAEIVDSVFTIEIVEPLAQRSAQLLARLGYHQVRVKHGDGFYGWEEHAPFDAIVVTAAAEFIPPALIEQLRDGGKMIIPVGSPFTVQQLVLVEKRNDAVTTRSLMPVRFVPFTRAHD